MRETSLFTFSFFHLRIAEREAIKQMIRASSRNEEGRIEARYPDLVIESRTSMAFSCMPAWPDGRRPSDWKRFHLHSGPFLSLPLKRGRHGYPLIARCL